MPTGHHVTSWRHPRDQADAGINIAQVAEMARLAERGTFDMIFLGGDVASRDAHIDALSRSARYTAHFEPLTLLSALALGSDCCAGLFAPVLPGNSSEFRRSNRVK